ncbi:MAG: hypothetical protein FGF53_10330, partial [Candidatus Brockarchaeota archaeon]|nr:hypothetical protein [Candidatus Brockarchaeota archaeon]
TDMTEPVAEFLKSLGYTVDKLRGYRKKPSIAQVEEFMNAMREIKDKSSTFDLTVDLHGTLPFLESLEARTFRNPLSFLLYRRRFTPLDLCDFIVFDRDLYDKLKKILFKGLPSFFSCVKIILDEQTAPAVRQMELEKKYIEFEISEVLYSMRYLPKALQKIKAEMSKP